MSDLAIKVENLAKMYRIGGNQKYRYKRFTETLTHMLMTPLNHLRNFRRPVPSDETLWALKDVSFEVKEGDVVGIIGRNGAGKSTLLKILSRITEPTKGEVELHGRIGSLLEVGTGFHPELTGRENIYLNGTILGMKKGEIDRKFDEIVAFAEVEKFLDTPVKRYSSGMYVRLAFAVAAHLEPEILVVDEVLAVGDAQFQKKCLGKMSEVAKEGRTVLFVSHNMAAVNLLCPNALLLNEGQLIQYGETAEVVTKYLDSIVDTGGERVWENPETAPGNERVRLHAVRIISDGQIKTEVDIDKEVLIQVEFWNLIPDSHLFTNIFLLDNLGGIILESAHTPAANRLPEEWFCKPHPVGLYQSTCALPANFLNDDRYFISVIVASCYPPTVEAQVLQALSFTVFDTGAMRVPGFGGQWNGVVRVPLAWQTEFLKPLELEGSQKEMA
jgi:lipopolysaccharide transport system ATP-binding protein